ncbi:GNAT family N-acetyltransferase [Streptomyces sp. NBC_01465]|uniref:GNAT family N-acetyltransferase n=1 Tax=Streptomyces sp. NBC_01465 TaxID=2903878 RepID=UPI002E309E01|nr:GNAT family protein [Streptomyces sp. NBC_01465]
MDQPLEVPVLAASGHVLRPWALSDLDLVREASADPYIPLVTTVPTPYSDEEGVAFVHRQWARAATRSGYPFVVAGDDGRAVGTVGLWLRDLEQGRASLGYWTVPSARGRGAASAALGAVAAWALDELRIPRLELHVEPWNTGSLRTAERAGFRREGLLRSWQEIGGERRDMVVHSMLRTDSRRGYGCS